MLATYFGAALIATPFIAITAMMVIESGWLDAAIVWGITLGVCGFIGVGVALLAYGVNQ